VNDDEEGGRSKWKFIIFLFGVFS